MNPEGKSVKELVDLIGTTTDADQKLQLLLQVGRQMMVLSPREGLPYTELAITIATKLKKDEELGVAYEISGSLHRLVGQYSQAIEFYEKSREIFMSIGQHNLHAKVIRNLGVLHNKVGDYKTALEHYQQALEIDDAQNNRPGRMHNLTNMGATFRCLEQYTTAIDCYDKALEIAEEMDSDQHRATILGNMGNIHCALGQGRQAVDTYTQAQKLHMSTGNKPGMAQVLQGLGTVYSIKGDMVKAMTHFKQAGRAHKELGNVAGEAAIALSLGKLYMLMARFDSAKEQLQKVLDTTIAMGDKAGECECHELLVTYYEKTHQPIKALEHFRLYHQLYKGMVTAEVQERATNLEQQLELERKGKEAEIYRLRNVELKKAYEELETAQFELILKERMAAIGKVATEIAHEVQNPLQFVNNFAVINQELLNDLERALDEGNDEEVMALMSDLNMNSHKIHEHGLRVSGIVDKLVEQTRLKGV